MRQWLNNLMIDQLVVWAPLEEIINSLFGIELPPMNDTHS